MRTCKGCSHPSICKMMGCGAEEVDAKRRQLVERKRILQIANSLADCALINGTVRVSGRDMDDIRRLLTGQTTSGQPNNTTTLALNGADSVETGKGGAK